MMLLIVMLTLIVLSGVVLVEQTAEAYYNGGLKAGVVVGMLHGSLIAIEVWITWGMYILFK